ncbi:DUF5606 family protein [Chryseobacterium wanjuense]
MLLEKIISISGKPGLYKLVSQLRNGFIIEDVTSKKKVSIGNSSQVSLLDNIAMFTVDKEVPLFEVFENIAKNFDYKEAIGHKSSDAELKEFMTASLQITTKKECTLLISRNWRNGIISFRKQDTSLLKVS